MSRKGNMATRRLRQDYLRIMRDPVPYVTAHPLPSNILDWHFVVRGPEGTPYEGGFYHGKLVFPSEFPFKPPSIYMITPNGRFKCNTRLCLSISDFHPDTWNPAWSVSTILTGLLSFMVEKNPTLGSIETSDFEKRQLALQSLDFNLKDPTFCEMFPEVVEEIKTSAERLMRRNGFVNRLENDLDQNNPDQIYQEQAPAAMGSTLTNIFVIMGFAVFAYVVKYVLSIVK
ncbi:ubiquitin-conjugating enzyme E2 J2 [Centruroides vittatus]|uniref:ubiquitin-conjugating enzyme E2 J2 n=1 Tax=Centruroides vittatus TaxID=120091 RepID=UPI00351026A5